MNSSFFTAIVEIVLILAHIVHFVTVQKPRRQGPCLILIKPNHTQMIERLIIFNIQ
jgi:hypothetical protein